MSLESEVATTQPEPKKKWFRWNLFSKSKDPTHNSTHDDTNYTDQSHNNPVDSPHSVSPNNSTHHVDERHPLLASELTTAELSALIRERRLAKLISITQFLVAIVDIVWIVLILFDVLSGIGVQPTQGSGFVSLFVTCLALFGLSWSILIPTTKSTDNTLNTITCGVLLLDVVIILATREIYRTVGLTPLLVSFILAELSILISMASYDCGDASTLFRKARQAFKYIMRLAMCIAASLLTVNLLLHAFDTHTDVGTVYTINDTKIRLTCLSLDSTGPVAIVEAGDTPSTELYSWVSTVNGFKTVCYWDHPGYGMSENAPSPLSLGTTAKYLQRALEMDPHISDEDELVLVAHGTGSLFARVFGGRTSYKVAGVVLIEPLHEVLYQQQQSVGHGIGLLIKGILSTCSYRNVKGLLTGHGSVDRVFGNLSLSKPGVYKFLLQQQLTARTISATEIITSPLEMKTPLLLLSSSSMCIDQTWTKYQRLHLKLTENAVAWKIIAGPHDLWRTPQGLQETKKEIEQFLNLAVHTQE